MQQLVLWFNSLLNSRGQDERGATAPEYGLLIALIAVLVVAAGKTLGQNIATVLTYMATQITAP